VPGASIADAYAPFHDEIARLLPTRPEVLDAHTHLGLDEDGQHLAPQELIAALEEAVPGARAVAFPLHDPERRPAYRLPNDRVLEWAASSGGRIVPYCRLDPAEDPLAEAERCLGLGARGIKLRPRAQAFTFDGNAVIAAIFELARDARVPILIHAGLGMAPMDGLAALAMRYPEVTVVLAHAGIADQAMFARTLAEHPAVLYDTSTFSPFDVIELFARVPAERVVFASDVPYGRPASGLYMALRVAALAGLDAAGRGMVAGGTMAAALAGELAPAQPPRLATVRPVSGALLRICGYVLTVFGTIRGSGGQPNPTRLRQLVGLVRAVCRDEEAGVATDALERIDSAIGAAESLLVQGSDGWMGALALMQGAAVIAATEPLEPSSE
jgi:uncharacterized protein